MNIKKAKRIFDSVNLIDSGMSYLAQLPTFEYHKPGYIDQFIETKICNSIISSSKPLEECKRKNDRIKSKEKVKRLIIKKIREFKRNDFTTNRSAYWNGAFIIRCEL